MASRQIFISHSSQDIKYAEGLYERLLKSRHWVWMDKKNLRAGELWEPQIEDNLRKSGTFIVLMSSNSVASDWVKHEGAMAFALNQTIIPVNIEPARAYASKALPIWARKIQLYDLYDGAPEYDDQLQILKRRLGKPFPIEHYLIDMLDHYLKSKVLLDEGALDLILAHYDEFRLTSAQRVIADELIEQSQFRLEGFWARYEKLNNAYKTARTEGLQLKQVTRSLDRAIRLRESLLALFVIAFLVMFVLALYSEVESWLPF